MTASDLRWECDDIPALLKLWCILISGNKTSSEESQKFFICGSGFYLIILLKTQNPSSARFSYRPTLWSKVYTHMYTQRYGYRYVESEAKVRNNIFVPQSPPSISLSLSLSVLTYLHAHNAEIEMVNRRSCAYHHHHQKKKKHQYVSRKFKNFSPPLFHSPSP